MLVDRTGQRPVIRHECEGVDINVQVKIFTLDGNRNLR